MTEHDRDAAAERDDRPERRDGPIAHPLRTVSIALPSPGKLLVTFVVAVAVIGSLAAGVGAYYITLAVRFPAGTLPPFLAGLSVLVTAAIAIAYVVHRRLTGHLHRWLEQPGDDVELAAWREGLNYPLYLSLTVSLCALGVSILAAAGVAIFTGSFQVTIHVAVSGFLASVVDTIFVWLYTQYSLRPVLKAMASRDPLLPVSGHGIVTLNLATKMVAVIIGASVVGAVVSGTLAFRGAEIALATGDKEWLALRILVVTGVSLLVSLSGCLLIARYATTPLEDLTAMLSDLTPTGYRERALPSDSDEIGQLMSTINHMLRGLEERERIEKTLHRYVTRQVSDLVLQRGDHLGGELVDVAILMADIRGFTPLSEKLPPHRVVTLLNRFFGEMVEECMNCGGLVDKFLGDGIMVVFGAPTRQSLDASCAGAARAALGMIRRLEPLNRCLAEDDLPAIRIGVGIHAGEVVAGNIGSPERLDYTFIGDPVNVAARIEKSCKKLGHEILVSGAVHDRLRSCAVMGEGSLIELLGRSEPIEVFPLHDLSALLPTPDRADTDAPRP